MSYAERGNNPQPKRYSRLTAQIIKSGVKKRIYELRKRKADAASELLSQLEESLEKSLIQKNKGYGRSAGRGTVTNSANTSDNAEIINEIAATIAEGINLFDRLGNRAHEEISVEELILKTLRSNRREVERLLIQLSEAGDAESLACFGTNLIYGGFITESSGNAPKTLYVEISDTSSPKCLAELHNILRKGNNEGRRVCIIRGNQLLNDKTIGIYRYFSDSAFILVDKSASMPTVQGVFNVLHIPEGARALQTKNSSVISGIAEFTANRVDTGKGANFGAVPSSSAISGIFRFISSPYLPISSCFEEFYSIICYIERLISKGRHSSPAVYKI